MPRVATSHRPRYRTDWFRVITDLRKLGLRQTELAALIDVPSTTLDSWKAGTEPLHHDGHKLLEVWCERLGLGPGDRPMCLR